MTNLHAHLKRAQVNKPEPLYLGSPLVSPCLLWTPGVEGAAAGNKGGAEAAAHRFGEKHVGFVLRTLMIDAPDIRSCVQKKNTYE